MKEINEKPEAFGKGDKVWAAFVSAVQKCGAQPRADQSILKE